jgi:hypothetical protein
MPGQKSVRCNDAGKAQKTFSTDWLALDCPSAPLIIVEPRAFAQLLFENADFLLEVFDDNLLVTVHPAGDAD